MLAGGDFERIEGLRSIQRTYMTSEIAEDAPGQQKHRFRLPTLSQRQADAITAVSNVIFAVALLPTVLAGTILPVATTLATLVALLMLGVVLAHFKLWWGFSWNLGCASMWLILLIIAL